MIPIFKQVQICTVNALLGTLGLYIKFLNENRKT